MCRIDLNDSTLLHINTHRLCLWFIYIDGCKLLMQFICHKFVSSDCSGLCRLLGKFDFPTMKFSLYFVGYEPLESVPEDEKERVCVIT